MAALLTCHGQPSNVLLIISTLKALVLSSISTLTILFEQGDTKKAVVAINFFPLQLFVVVPTTITTNNNNNDEKNDASKEEGLSSGISNPFRSQDQSKNGGDSGGGEQSD